MTSMIVCVKNQTRQRDGKGGFSVLQKEKEKEWTVISRFEGEESLEEVLIRLILLLLETKSQEG